MHWDFDTYRDFLSAELSRRTSANPRYSQRAFARHLKMSPGELSEILRGKRQLSLKSATKISSAFGLEGGTSLPMTRVSLDRFAVVSDWYCVAILHLADCEGFCWEPGYLAGRLGISPEEAHSAVERLERVGLVERKRGKLRVSKEYVLAGEEIPSEAVRHYHRQILMRAAQALETQTVDEREISGFTFGVDPARLPEMKKEISKVLERLGAKYSGLGKKREVYTLELALFRLSEKETQ